MIVYLNKMSAGFKEGLNIVEETVLDATTL